LFAASSQVLMIKQDGGRAVATARNPDAARFRPDDGPGRKEDCAGDGSDGSGMAQPRIDPRLICEGTFL